MIEIVGFVV